jgi:hypothetical protein
METIKQKGRFADDAERQKVLGVYQAGVRLLEERIRDADGGSFSP